MTLISFAADPDLFGYTLEQEDSGPTFRPIESVRDRFQLVLLGQDRGAVEIPLTLSHVVEVVPSAMYPEFYEAFDTCDLLIPAFNGNDYANRLAVSGIAVLLNAVLMSPAELLDRSRWNCRTSHHDGCKAAQGIRSSRRACSRAQTRPHVGNENCGKFSPRQS